MRSLDCSKLFRETQVEGTTMAAAKEISTDAAIGAVFTKKGIFTEE